MSRASLEGYLRHAIALMEANPDGWESKRPPRRAKLEACVAEQDHPEVAAFWTRWMQTRGPPVQTVAPNSSPVYESRELPVEEQDIEPILAIWARPVEQHLPRVLAHSVRDYCFCAPLVVQQEWCPDEKCIHFCVVAEPMAGSPRVLIARKVEMEPLHEWARGCEGYYTRSEAQGGAVMQFGLLHRFRKQLAQIILHNKYVSYH